VKDYGKPSWQWWSLDEGDEAIAGQIKALRETIKQRDDERRLDLSAMRSMYLDLPNDRFERWAFSRTRRSRYNLVQGTVDGVHAQMVTHRVRPRVITSGADHEAQRKAKKRQQWLDETLDLIDAQELQSEMVLDGEQYGTGVLMVGTEDDRPMAWNVFPGDVWVDPREERYLRRKVRTFYYTTRVERCVLQVDYPEHEKELEHIPGCSSHDDVFPDLDLDEKWLSPDQLEVTEAWRLPVRSKAKPGEPGAGRHVVVCGDVVLLDEPWEIKRPPFVFFVWAPAGRFWGQGLVERAAGMQSDLNKFCETINETYATFPPQLWVDDSAGVEVTSINDVLGKINRCKPANGDISTAVQLISGDVSPNLLARESEIAGRFMPVLGVDVMAAQAEKPAGLNSGEALRNYKDFTSQRFISPQRRFEKCACVLAELLFFFGEKLAKAGIPQVVLGGKDMEEVDLGDHLALDHERFKVEIKPGSALPRDISGRVQTILDMQAAGMPMDPVQLAELLDMPDTETMLARLTAGRELVRRAVEDCNALDLPQPVAHSFWPREWALSELVIEIQLAEVNGADERVLERLRNLHGHLLSLPDPNAPPPTMAPPGGPTPPPGPPGAPPLPPTPDMGSMPSTMPPGMPMQ